MSLQEHFQFQIDYVCGYCLLHNSSDNTPAKTEWIMYEEGWRETVNIKGKSTLTCPDCAKKPLEERRDG